MISRYFGSMGEAPFRAPALTPDLCRLNTIGMLQPLTGFLLAAGFVLSLAGHYEAQLIRAERVQQEVIGR